MDDKEEKKEAKVKRRKTLPVRVVEKKGKSALVEWDEGDDQRRGFVPVKEIEGGKCGEDGLGAAIPYGAPWEQFIDLSELNAETLARNLRRLGVWTADDLERNPKALRQALGDVLNVNRLRQAAKRHEGGNK